MKVNLRAAKASLSQLIERVRGGEEVIITRAGRPVARLEPIFDGASKREPGTLRGRVRVTSAFFDPLPSDEQTSWDPDPRRG